MSGPKPTVFATVSPSTRARLEALQSKGNVCGVAPSLSGLAAAAIDAGLPALERAAGLAENTNPEAPRAA